MSDPVPEKARTRAVLERMYDWIDEVLVIYYSDYFITTNFEFDISNTPAFPTVVINNEPSELTDPHYGRYTPVAGSLVSNNFTLYVYEKQNTSSLEDDYRDAQIVTRRVIDYLHTKNQNSTEMSTHGIWFVHTDSFRRSETGIREISRYIIYVTVESIREDNP